MVLLYGISRQNEIENIQKVKVVEFTDLNDAQKPW